MHILLTGSTGFVGRLTAERLAAAGHTITGVSRSGPRPGSVRNDGTKINAIVCDLGDRNQTAKVFDAVEKIDCVIHLAGQTFKKGAADAHIYFDGNHSSTLNILECCRTHRIPRVVYSSTIAVYGLAQGQALPDYLPVDEKHRIRPYDFYDLSKAQAESLVEYYSGRYGIAGTILRYSRIYGPGTEKAIVYSAIMNARENKPIQIMGDITSDFVYVGDAADANVAAATQTQPFGVFNIGSGEEVSLYDLCSSIVKLCNSGSELVYIKEPRARFSLDITRARNLLQYRPIGLQEGLSKTIRSINDSYGRY